ncbi:hypothetical protein SAMN05519104_5428 [Rhizobiales bacterium GAS188]|nr:hypothetical protein SAMN05519104_5428 [Rhizobiales bacterium GAS188]
MLTKMRTVLALVVTMSSGGPVIAIEKCPVNDIDSEKAGSYAKAVEAALRKAPNCERAYRMLEACQLGSTADNALSVTVQSKCEPMFIDKADAATKKAYKRAQLRCDKIAERNSGTMYQSFAAVCLAGAARDFARKYSGAK